VILPPTWHVVFCGWPTCPAVRSTASAAMKQPSGARPARSCLLSMFWIVANHKREGGVSGSEAGKICRPMDAMTIEPCGALTYAIDAELGRAGRAIGINRGLRQLGLFR
jgi:hypothetical protein